MPFLFYQSLHFPYYPTNNFWLIIPKNTNFKIWNFKNWAKHRSQLVLGHTKQNIQYSWVCNRLKTTNKTRKKTTNYHLDQRSMWDLMPSLYSCMWNSQKPNSRREVPVQPSASNWFNTIWKSPQITWKPLSDQALTLLSSPVLKTSYQKLFLGRGKENPQWRWPHEMQKLFKPKLHLHSGLTAWDWDLSATLWATSTNKRIWQRGLCMGMHLGYGWQFVFGINFNHRRRIIDAESESKCMHRTNKIEIRHWKQNMNLQRPSIGCKERKNRNIYQDFLENPQKNATRIHPSTNTFVNATPHPKIWKNQDKKIKFVFHLVLLGWLYHWREMKMTFSGTPLRLLLNSSCFCPLWVCLTSVWFWDSKLTSTACPQDLSTTNLLKKGRVTSLVNRWWGDGSFLDIIPRGLSHPHCYLQLSFVLNVICDSCWGWHLQKTPPHQTG